MPTDTDALTHTHTMTHHHTLCVHCSESYEVVADHKDISKFCCADAANYDDDYNDYMEYFHDFY